MKKILETKDFSWDDIHVWMRFTLWDKNKIKRNEWLIEVVWDVKILWWKLIFKDWDNVIVTETQLVKYALNDWKSYNEVTFQIERNWELLKKWEEIVNFTFNWNLLIHHLFPISISDISQVLLDARQKSKWNIEEVLDKKNRD